MISINTVLRKTTINASILKMASHLENNPYLKKMLEFIKEKESVLKGGNVVLDGKHLTIPVLYALGSTAQQTRLDIATESKQRMGDNARYLENKLADGAEIYGINTGLGGSADVRTNQINALQNSVIRQSNVGFGSKLPLKLVKTVMAVRANSLSLGFSGVWPETVQLLIEMYNNNIIPYVPKRGSISASGDLMPTSYIGAAMMGRPDIKVNKSGIDMPIAQALKEAKLQPVIFKAKEALAVINSASFASSLAACVLYETNFAVVLTQIATGLTVEGLEGRVHSFHPTIHQCLPHPGQIEVASVISGLLEDSRFATHYKDRAYEKSGTLKQDRYALRTSPQWLGPVVETVLESIRRVTTELNSANDNPLFDHETDEALHCGNFQGTALTVAMDQCRQSIQLCGRLLLAQYQEIVDSNMNNGLTPNLAGSDVTVDFGFKGADITMAGYQSELDYLTNNVTNHVHSAELHNQSVNSLALISARYTQKALKILNMMIANIFVAQLQAVDLRHLKNKTESILDELYSDNNLILSEPIRNAFPWYYYVFSPEQTASKVLEQVYIDGLNKLMFCGKVGREISQLRAQFYEQRHTQEVEALMGKGTRKIYRYIRGSCDVPFLHDQCTPDVLLEKTYAAISPENVAPILLDVFDN